MASFCELRQLRRSHSKGGNPPARGRAMRGCQVEAINAQSTFFLLLGVFEKVFHEGSWAELQDCSFSAV